MRCEAIRLGLADEEWKGCLLMADMAGQNSLETIMEAQRLGALEGWSISSTENSASLKCCQEKGGELLIIKGRQISCAEGIELLALGCSLDLGDGLPTQEVFDQVRQSKAILVIPWGFGKWWFQRGARVAELVESLDQAAARELFLGDNRGRPQAAHDPQMFDLAREKGLRILAGSDPLPFQSQVKNVGRYGFVLPGELCSKQPIKAIKKAIFRNSEQPKSYGRRESFIRFCQQQLAMQLRKLRTKSSNS